MHRASRGGRGRDRRVRGEARQRFAARNLGEGLDTLGGDFGQDGPENATRHLQRWLGAREELLKS